MSSGAAMYTPRRNAVTASPDFIAAAAVWQTPTISREPYMMLMISDVRWREKE